MFLLHICKRSKNKIKVKTEQHRQKADVFREI